jgi:two-component system OmpR family response regulator
MSSEEKKWRILLVDDDEMILELLLTRLEGQGYYVRTAADGEIAYEVATDFRPHVIICDVIMPHVDGPSFCRRMRAENNPAPMITW